jgi:3-hydroxybutyryl-CoA dehydrogenase
LKRSAASASERWAVLSAETVDAIHELSRRLDKSPIGVKNSPGFVVYRILVPMINEAFFVLAEGIAQRKRLMWGCALAPVTP